jgi:hypothetical protein
LTHAGSPASSPAEEVAMATQQEKMGHKTGTERLQMEGGVGSPVSNDAYNIIACLHEKLQGLEAMRKFCLDADEHIWKNVCQLDLQAVDVLVTELERIVKAGKLRAAVTQQGKQPTA